MNAQTYTPRGLLAGLLALLAIGLLAAARGRIDGIPYSTDTTYYQADAPTTTVKLIKDIETQWDLVEKDNRTHEAFRARILERVAPFTDIPILFISVKEKQRVLKVLEAAMTVYKNRIRKIPTIHS